MTHLPVPPAQPCRSRGGAGGAGRGQWVCYPLRVVTDAEAYAPADTNFYGKVRALSHKRVATASMAKLAGFLGWSKSTAERSAHRLGQPAPTDGVQELFTKRQTHKITGTGQTAERWCRDLDKGEPYVWAPVRAADVLRGLLHRLYLGLRYAIVVRRHQPTLTELAELLRHHGGKTPGQALAEATVSRLLDELAALGWITLDKRAGYRGRHAITVHDDPLHPATEPEPTPDPDDGSGPDLDDGSPAYKEDLELNDPGNTGRAGGSFRRRRGDRKWVAAPVDNSLPASVASVAPATFRPAVRPPQRPAYAGPPLSLSPDAWALLKPVLAPVSDLLPHVSAFMTRRIVREVLRQIRGGIWPDDIRDQIARLRAWTPDEDIRDPGRWLLGAVLPVRPGPCGTPDCHYGFQRHTGTPCKACEEHPRGRRGHPPHTAAAKPPEPLLACPGCDAPYRPPLRHTHCRLCHTELPDTA